MRSWKEPLRERPACDFDRRVDWETDDFGDIERSRVKDIWSHSRTVRGASDKGLVEGAVEAGDGATIGEATGGASISRVVMATILSA